MNKDNSRNMQRQQAIAEKPATATPPEVQPTITRMPACQHGRTAPPQTQVIAETLGNRKTDSSVTNNNKNASTCKDKQNRHRRRH
jgi:hypothetical protein